METTSLTPAEKPLRFILSYPWLSLVSTLLGIAYAVLLHNPQQAAVLGIMQVWLRPDYLTYLWIGLLGVYWWDYRRYRRQVRALEQQFQKLWSSRQQLQQRAQLSSSHTDKLKLFISDKLLEYIEYDEKYLHFKSIAKEVRHNGVISFDKVQQALTQAQEANPESTVFTQAQVSMRYLWDLLDLSTADNIAMHIAGEISRLEELLYQAELTKTAIKELPIQPLFSAEKALLNTLNQHLGVQWTQPSEALSNYKIVDNEQQFELNIAPCSDLVGNINHLILLLENLLKNAQFFAGMAHYASPFPNIMVTLQEQQHCLLLSIYNRGPHIEAENQAQLFQLGFSTRPSQGHHGKGLGLYFAQQIAQGFDGALEFSNVENHQDELYLRLELENGEAQHVHIQQQLVDGLAVLTCLAQGEEGQNVITLPCHAPVKSMEFSTQNFPKVQSLAVLTGQSQLIKGQQYAHWQLSINQQGDELSLQALDVQGVLCTLRLPTYQGRQQGMSGAKSNEVDVASLHSQFQHPDDF